LLRIWNILDEFKEYCKRRDWSIHEKVDVIEAGNEYHRFIWTSHLYPDTFRRVVTHPSYCIPEDTYCRMIKISYVAWLLSEDPPASLMKMLRETPKITKKVAIYNMRPVLTGKRECQRLNETKSVVFAAFEEFLKDRYRMKLRLIKR